MEHEDESILIKGALVLPLDDGEEVARRDIRVTGATISAIEDDLPPESSDRVVDASGCYVVPGMIAAATDSMATLFEDVQQRIGDSGREMTLSRSAFDAALDAEARHAGRLIGFRALLKQGVTTVCDGVDGISVDRGFAAAKSAGIRFVGGPRLSDLIDGAQGVAGLLDSTRDIIAQWHGVDGDRIRVGVFLGGPMGCGDVLLQEAAALAFENNLTLHCDASLSLEEVAHIEARSGCPPVEFLMEMGCLGSQTLLSGCNFLQDEEPNFLFGTGTHVVDLGELPRDSARLASDRSALLADGINVAFGTLAGSGQKMQLLQRSEQMGWSSQAILQQCVEGGAAALGWDDSVGFLQMGYAADLVVVEGEVDPNSPHGDVLRALQSGGVREVVINGRLRVAAGEWVDRPEDVDYTNVVQRVAEVVCAS